MSDNNDWNKNKKIEIDDMNIRSHLNTSLDLEEINVSEELFNRTLAAIKEQQAQREEHGATKGEEKFGAKMIPWSRYVRSFAGVAAALILVVAGYQLIKQMPIVKNETTSKDNAVPESNLMMRKSTSDEAKADMASEETPAAASATSDTAEAEDADRAMQKEGGDYTIMAETTAEDAMYGLASNGSSTENASGQGGTEGETLITSVPDDGSKTSELSTVLGSTNDSVVTYTFRDIFLSTPEEAEYITISSNLQGISITLTALEDIQAFYLVMDSHQFTGDEQATTTDQDYTVEVKNPNTQALYTMYLGSTLIVKYTQGDYVSESAYSPDDDTLLKQDIETFLQEYGE